MKGAAKYLGLLALPLLLAGVANEASSAMGNPARGAELYGNCVPCHQLEGKGVAGLPVERLMEKMQGYQKAAESDKPKVRGMQKVLKPLSEQDLMDLAAYMTKM